MCETTLLELGVINKCFNCIISLDIILFPFMSCESRTKFVF